MEPIDLSIIEVFQHEFSHLKEKPIVLYGIGGKTKLIIEYFQDFHFVGLMDRDKERGTCYGLPMLTKEECIKKAYCIIIVCTVGSTLDIIYRRIQGWTEIYNIPVFHVSGKHMKSGNQNEKAVRLVCNLDEYKREIQKHGIISFDLFDTLIMRRTLYPTDIFLLVQKRLKNIHSEDSVEEFSVLRKKAELQAIQRQSECYTLDDIYNQLDAVQSELILPKKDIQQLEIQTELENLIPRETVITLLEYAKTLGKTLILVTDTYFSKAEITRFLNICGISENIFNKIYISNELGMTKQKGSLWKYISEEYRDHTILHFGDNPISDGLQAQAYNISVLHTPSAIEMAMAVLDQSWMKYEIKPLYRYIMGIFISKLFNSPFTLDQSGKKYVTSLEEVGYAFFGPLVKCFLDKLYQTAKEKKQKIIFLARDGWLLKYLADKYYTDYLVENVYFLTSRRAAALASVKDSSDIEAICDAFRDTEHTFGRFCEVIFNITVDSADEFKDSFVKNLSRDQLISHIINHYAFQILNEAKLQRRYTDVYIDKVGIDKNENMAIVNFVGSGTTQFYLEKLGFLGNSEYYYFGTTALRLKTQLRTPINVVYGTGNVYISSGSGVTENIKFGETVFTSPQSQFMGFTAQGDYMFADDGQNQAYREIQKCHIGIEHYLQDCLFFEINFHKIEPEFVDLLYGYLSDSQRFYLEDQIKNVFFLKDIVKSDSAISIWN